MFLAEADLILPVGPEDAGGLVVGEAGGYQEHRAHRPFVGKAGGVLTAYLKAAGLVRAELRITNVFSFWTGPSNPEPTKEQIRSEEWRLVEELKLCRPRVIAAVGRVALDWFFPHTEHTLDAIHGVPLPFSICFSCGVRNYASIASEPTQAHSQNEDVLDLDGSEDRQRIRDRHVQEKEGEGTSTSLRVSGGAAPSASRVRSSVLQQGMRESKAHRVRHDSREHHPRISEDQDLSARAPENGREYPIPGGEGWTSRKPIKEVSVVRSGFRGKEKESTKQKGVDEAVSTSKSRKDSSQEPGKIPRRRGVQRTKEAGLATISGRSQGRDKCCSSPDVLEATVVGCFHPAASFYSPEKAALSQDDFHRFAYYLANPVVVKKKPRIRVIYHEEAPEWIEDAAVDTEGLEDRPWGMSWSRDGKTTHVWIYSPEKRAPKLRGRILFHNALHDLKILRAMGIDTRGLDYGDTMVMAYDLQLEPQGLKPLSFRHLGLRMTAFDETVRKHYDKLAVAWLRKAAAADYPEMEVVAVRDMAKKMTRPYKPQGVGRRISNILKSWEKEKGEGEDETKIEKRWEKVGKSLWIDQTPEYQRLATEAVGEEFPEFSIFCVPHKKAVRYSGVDAAATHLIHPHLSTLIDARDLRQVYEMDRKALPFVDRMQEVGMRVDPEALAELEVEVKAKREGAARDVRQVVGDRWFNPGSGDQVAEWLFEKKRLQPSEFTETGRGSTKDEALQMLRGQHSDDRDVVRFLGGIQDYREADKLQGTFIEPIFSYLQRDGRGDWRLRPNFRITRVVSGRLSSHEPNVLAIPTRSELGQRVRKCFVARDGCVVLGADLSQIELRMGAHFSGDRRMRQAFLNDEDLHTLTASIIFRVALEAVTKSQRYVAKTVNFAVFYGISPNALLAQLWKASIFDYRYEDCERFIREWFEIYAGVRGWQHRLWDQAERDGFVRTMFGRICYVPNLRVVSDQKMMEAARRLAGNMPIQGSASDLVKRAETRLHERIEKGGLREKVQPWLQMHDELILEVEEGLAEEVKAMVVEELVADGGMLSVPVKAEAAWGRSWGEAKA